MPPAHAIHPPIPPPSKDGGVEGSGAPAPEGPVPTPSTGEPDFQDLVDKAKRLGCYTALIRVYDKLPVSRLDSLLETAAKMDGIPGARFTEFVEEALGRSERELGDEERNQ